MPAYQNPYPGGITAVYPGDTVTVFNAEQPAAPAASQSLAIAPDPLGLPAKLSVELLFSGAPGVFEVDLQTADTDTDAAYENYPVSGAISAVDANQRARAEFVNIVAKFARLRIASRANAVNLTAKLSR